MMPVSESKICGTHFGKILAVFVYDVGLSDDGWDANGIWGLADTSWHPLIYFMFWLSEEGLVAARRIGVLESHIGWLSAKIET